MGFFVRARSSGTCRSRRSTKEPNAYDAKAQELAGRFLENFVQFADSASPGICEAGPTLWR